MIRLLGWLLAAAMMVASSASAQTSFITFESGHVRPLALSPDGTRLFAVNTPDNRLEVFDVGAAGLTFAFSIPVGMEPVAVAARNNTEVWVVNHLSDSVSVVDLTATPPRVVRTLLVGDEPRDIVFAGGGGNRAFITTAHRGQHRTHVSLNPVPGLGADDGDPQPTTASVDRADVWVFDASNLGAAMAGTPVGIATFFSDTPRALAVSPDGSTVYVAAFHSGNQTTAILEATVCNGFLVSGGTNCPAGAPGGVPGPSNNDPNLPSGGGIQAPETGLILKKQPSGQWHDSIGRNWSAFVNFDLPDHDVFTLDADTLVEGAIHDHVGTILFNMAVHPTSGKLYVTNTELPNHIRFEGPGNHGGSTVQGHLSESRITVIDPVGLTVQPRHLNLHIDYSELHTGPTPPDPNQVQHSLATPLQPAITQSGNTIYVPAFGSAKIGVLSTAVLEDPNYATLFDPTSASADYIPTGGGPSGVVLDEDNGRLYVLTRFDNSVAAIDLGTKATLETHALHNPEPQSVVEGRPFLYDAVATSGNGEASCSSCHIFADFDSLAWNLGDPDAPQSSNTQPSATPFLPISPTTLHSMKGPMTTQTLRGMATHGALHWRGDRVDGFFQPADPCTEPSGAPCSEELSFNNFIVAFEGLVGHEGILDPNDMQKFTDFALQLMLPPNPVRALDNSLTASQQAGRNIYFGCGPGATECAFAQPGTSDQVEDCDGCHSLDPANGFFGSGGQRSFEGTPQHAKVPHLRNAYQKIGMFGISNVAVHRGPQVRGFGFLHDGSVDTLKSFFASTAFTLTATQENDVEQLSLAFDSDLAPIVGQQITLRASDLVAGACPAPVGAEDTPCERVNTLVARSAAAFTSLLLGGVVSECNLVVKGSVAGLERGWVREASGQFRDDHNNLVSDAALRGLAASEGALTYTCAPPGSGTRMGINRDEDSALDGLDNCVAVANSGQDNFDADAQGDACDPDDDNDTLLDVVETNTGTYVSPQNTGTDPFDLDTDDDGYDDAFEVASGSDPTDPFSTPALNPIPVLPGWALGLLIGLLLLPGAVLLRATQRTSRT